MTDVADYPVGGIDNAGCGWCSSDDVETQGHAVLCLKCGRWSEFDGKPIQGNAHHRANISTTFPEANRHGIWEFRKD